MIKIIAAAALIGAVIAAMPTASTPHAAPHAAHATMVTGAAAHGDRVTEDDPRWSCRLADRAARGVCLIDTRAGATWHAAQDIDGHARCAMIIGDTSVIACADGYAETS
jgi:hypothetical protein